MQTVRYIVAVLVATGPQAHGEPNGQTSGFAEVHADWIHAVHDYAGVGEGFSTGVRAGFFPATSLPFAISAGVELSCAQHLSCWKGGMIGARYERALAPNVALSIDGLVGLETVGLHVSRQLYGYLGVVDLGLRYRSSSFSIGPQLGTSTPPWPATTWTSGRIRPG